MPLMKPSGALRPPRTSERRSGSPIELSGLFYAWSNSTKIRQVRHGCLRLGLRCTHPRAPPRAGNSPRGSRPLHRPHKNPRGPLMLNQQGKSDQEILQARRINHSYRPCIQRIKKLIEFVSYWANRDVMLDMRGLVISVPNPRLLRQF